MTQEILIKNMVSNWFEVLKALDIETEKNIIITGSVALILQGQRIQRKPHDLDIIIEIPSAKQRETLNILKTTSIKFNYDDDDKDNFIISRGDQFLNIFISDAVILPSINLYCEILAFKFKVKPLTQIYVDKFKYLKLHAKHRFKDIEDASNLLYQVFNTVNLEM